MKKLSNLLVSAMLAVSLVFSPVVMTSCSTFGGNTATEQIMTETQNPMAIAKAAFLDAVTKYNELGERYSKYIPYMEQNHLGAHRFILDAFTTASNLLDTWNDLILMGGNTSNVQLNFEALLENILKTVVILDGGNA